MIINKLFLDIIQKSYEALEEKLKLNRFKNKMKSNKVDTPKFTTNINFAQKMEEFQNEMFNKGSEKKK